MSGIDEIRFDLLLAFETEKDVDIATWIARYPEHGHKILDIWLWMHMEAQEETDPPPVLRTRLRSVADDALQRACLGASLGREWLKPVVREPLNQGLAEKVRALRLHAYPKPPRSRRPFRRAVVCGWLVGELSAVRDRVTRLTFQKTAYLVEEALALNLFDEHEQKPLGPYDHKARYKDAEPIAVRKGWIEVAGSTLTVGENAAELNRWAAGYLRSLDLARQLTRLIGALSDAQLETWSTVLWVVKGLAPRPAPTPRDIRGILKGDSRWSAKLKRGNFAEDDIRGALMGLGALGVLPAE